MNLTPDYTVVSLAAPSGRNSNPRKQAMRTIDKKVRLMAREVLDSLCGIPLKDLTEATDSFGEEDWQRIVRGVIEQTLEAHHMIKEITPLVEKHLRTLPKFGRINAEIEKEYFDLSTMTPEEYARWQREQGYA